MVPFFIFSSLLIELLKDICITGRKIEKFRIIFHGNGLIFAAEKGHVDVVILLLENGADVNAVDEDGMYSTSLRSKVWTR